MDNHRQPTLQEIADKCGVSKTTVSLALRNHPKISEGTRLKIQKVADEIGYHPNPLVAAHMATLRTRRASQYQATLGLISDWPIEDLIDSDEGSDHYSESTVYRYIQGIRKRATELGFEVDMISISEPGMSGKRATQILESRGIRGIIMTPLSTPEGSYDLDWSKFATVALGYSMRAPQVHRVCHDNYSTMRVVTRYLRELGFNRIRVAMDLQDDIRVKNLWTGGFLSRMSFYPEYSDIQNFVTDEWNKDAFVQWLKDEKPDAVISIGDIVLEWASSAGYRVPEDFAVVTVGKIGGAISGYSQNSELMGEAAVDKLVGLLHTNTVGVPDNPQVVLVQGEWFHGRTLGRCAPIAPVDEG